MYLNGTGFALLQNTHINASAGGFGAAIYANDGGSTSPQLIMGQTTDCNVQGYLVLEKSKLIHAVEGGKIRLNRVGLLRNRGYAMLGATDSSIEATHTTVAANLTDDGDNSKAAYLEDATINLQNSLVSGSSGADTATGNNAFYGSCNLTDNAQGWPSPSGHDVYYIGAALLINAGAGDARQTADSPGVDMCLQDTFSWSPEIDIEHQNAPVNESTNPQGLPGQTNGLYDAGFDEVYDSIAGEEYQLTVVKEGTGSGLVSSNTGAILCGMSCSATLSDGERITLGATADSGSMFTGWQNCTNVTVYGNCYVEMNDNLSVRAEFKPEVIFRDGFEN